MICHIKKTALYFLMTWTLLFMLSSALEAGAVTFHGKTVDVDLSDIERIESVEDDETAVRRIAADVVVRYHDAGYTGFRVVRAVRHDDGTLDLYFNEGVVSGIVIRSDDGGDGDIPAAEIFTVGEPYNEHILGDNIELVKNRYYLRYAGYTASRMEDGSLEIIVNVGRRRFFPGFYVTGDPLHGAIPSLYLGYAGNSFFAEALLRSSLGGGGASLN